MADSHITSNLVAKDGDETISGFEQIQGDRVVCATLNATAATIPTLSGTTISGTTVAGSTSVTGGYVVGTSYVRVGTAKYLFGGNVTNLSASIVAAATALVATPIKGSIYMGNGEVWGFDSDTTATKMW